MAHEGHRSSSHRHHRSERHHRDPLYGSALGGVSAAFPNASNSGSATNPSDYSMELDPNPPPVHPQDLFLDDTFPPCPYSALDPGLSGPGLNPYLPTEVAQAYYATPEPEATGYGTYGGSDDLASSLYVSPGSPPLPPPPIQHSPTPDGSEARKPTERTAKHEKKKKKKSQKTDQGGVSPWGSNPSNILPTQDAMAVVDQPYHLDSLGLVGAVRYQPTSLYPPELTDVDVYGHGHGHDYGQGYDHGHGHPSDPGYDGVDDAEDHVHQDQEEEEHDWDMCDVEPSGAY